MERYVWCMFVKNVTKFSSMQTVQIIDEIGRLKNGSCFIGVAINTCGQSWWHYYS